VPAGRQFARARPGDNPFPLVFAILDTNNKRRSPVHREAATPASAAHTGRSNHHRKPCYDGGASLQRPHRTTCSNHGNNIPGWRQHLSQRGQFPRGYHARLSNPYLTVTATPYIPCNGLNHPYLGGFRFLTCQHQYRSYLLLPLPLTHAIGQRTTCATRPEARLNLGEHWHQRHQKMAPALISPATRPSPFQPLLRGLTIRLTAPPPIYFGYSSI